MHLNVTVDVMQPFLETFSNFFHSSVMSESFDKFMFKNSASLGLPRDA